MKIASIAIMGKEDHGSPIYMAIPTWNDPIQRRPTIRVARCSNMRGKHICRIIELQEIIVTIGPHAVNRSLNSGHGPNRWVCNGLYTAYPCCHGAPPALYKEPAA